MQTCHSFGQKTEFQRAFMSEKTMERAYTNLKNE